MIIDSVLNRNVRAEKVVDTHEAPEENIKRSLAKTISWRVVGTLDTLLISWIVIGKLDAAILIGGVELVTKMVLYFYHERAWNKIKWGK